MFDNKDISIYIHYPFCLSKCPYCDFNSYKMLNVDMQQLENAYITELNYYYNLLKDRTVKTIFFGGGTPSLMPIKMLSTILNNINSHWDIDKDVEISIEANPTSVEVRKFCEYKSLGINRISIGIQSLDENDLHFLGRQHTVNDAKNAIKLAQKYFGSHYSIDLIYARSEQKLDKWKNELNEAIKLSPFHISLYQLIIAEGTKFFKDKIQPLDDENCAIFYSETNNILENNNIHCYEVSNYAQNGYECKHNLNYWKSGEWIGVGAGAHGRICLNNNLENTDYKERIATQNYNGANKWIQQIQKLGHGAESIEILAKNDFIEEVLLMGLRMPNGIKLEDVQKYININNIEDLALNKENFLMLKNKKYIEVLNNTFRVNKKYFSILDSIIGKLI